MKIKGILNNKISTKVNILNLITYLDKEIEIITTFYFSKSSFNLIPFQ